MRLSGVTFILFASAAVSVNAQESLFARFSPFCGLFNNKIYCYGGFKGTRDQNEKDSVMFVLDISNANGVSMTELQDSWKIETPNTAGVNTEKRRGSQCGTVGTKLVMSGGVGNADSDPAMVDQTIAYDVEDNTWKKYPNYVEGTFGNRQIYFASTTEVPSKGLAFYGGFERPYNQNWNIATSQNLSATLQGNFRAIGYTSVTYLDITNTNRPWVIASQTNAPTVFSAFQASVYHPASAKIFYFGGTFEDTLAPGYAVLAYKGWHQFSYALTFDTFSGAWGNQTLNGGVFPTERRFHTTTLLPNGQSTVLLYGGERRETASSDFCFTLDLVTYAWTQLNINASAVDLRRTKHSAILANNESLFIVFGLNSVSAATSMPIVLNISNPSTITYVEKYTDPNASANGSSNTTGTTGSEETKGLSKAATIGIGVAVAIVVVIGLIAAFFCWRKRKAKKQNVDQHTNQVNHSHEAMEVNWDEIDKQYVEIPTKLTAPFPSPPFDNATPPSTMRHENESVTVFGNNNGPTALNDHTSTQSGSIVHTTTAHISPFTQNAVSHAPNSFDEVRQPYISKPDGANIS